RCKIAQGDDADEPLILVDDRKPTDLPLLHLFGGVTDAVIGMAVVDIRAHRILDLETVRSLAGGSSTHRNVTVGDHSYQPFALADRQRTDVQLVHLARRLLNGGVGPDDFRVTSHDVADFHEI